MRQFVLLTLLAAAVGSPVAAQDFEREARWRAEVVPNVVVGDPVDLQAGGRTFLGLFTEAANAPTAVLIAHGIGVHPDHGIIGTLRMALADRGFSTLSIQMPILAAEAPADDYARLFPLAAERIDAASRWLAGRGYRDIVLVSHSMGSRMANAYIDAEERPAVRAWVALGLGGEFSRRFADRKPLPVLDVLGSADLPAVLTHAPARRRVAESTPGGRQLRISGADHFYAGRHIELVDAIAAFARR